MTTLTVALSDGFLSAYSAIPRGKQKKVLDFVTKFRQNPLSPGINYERINDASDANFRSVRIDQDYRGIVLSPEKGNAYVLLWVDKHDDAYDWARRHKCPIHPETGTLQLLQAVEQTMHVSPTPEEVEPEAEAPLLFAQRDRELLRLGVPEEHLPVVRAVRDETGVEQLEGLLPKEAFEALYLLAAGSSLDEVMREYAVPDRPVDTKDFSAALQRDHSQRQFSVIEDDAELLEMMNAPLEKWRVFLHPSQRRIVRWDCNGPVRVLGGAGTGKTVVAMHRARWLVRNRLPPGRKLLFTTFTANLATDIQENLRKICRPDELERIEVINIDAWVSRFLKRNRYPSRIVYPGDKDYEKAWQLALDAKPADPSLPDSFYAEEWERIVLPQHVTEQKDYLRAKRTGRGVALNRRQRMEIWPVFEELLIQLHQRGLRTSEQATQDAAALLQVSEKQLPYGAVVIDEAQDMGPEVMMLLRYMLPQSANDLFIVGDAHQRIYRRRYALTACGIDIRGRSRRLRINYRTTEETRRFAVSVLEGVEVDDLDGGADSHQGYRSLMHGRPPEIRKFSNREAEVDWVSERLRELEGGGAELADVCLVARVNWLLKGYEEALQARNISVHRINRQQIDDKSRPGVRLATMHRVKGLEFRYVFIVAANDGVVPLTKATESSKDPTERASAENAERALFHVAATRAVNALFVSASDVPSPFISPDV
tara:strand:+ start:112 stop:2241 length:2130 start_codon:yes stop_codon:yes gene_type:complete